MDTVNSSLTDLLQQIGVRQDTLNLTQRAVIIDGILIVAVLADFF